MSPVTKNEYINKLENIVNEYNNACHSTIKMRFVYIKSRIYIDFNIESK